TLLRRGVRQIGVLRATSAGIAQAPTIDERAGSLERAREGLLQLEQAAELYADATGADLLADAERLIGAVPTPASWVESALAQLLLCLAAQVELETSLEPNARRALARETEHVNAARAALYEAKAFSSELRDSVRAGSSTPWLNMALDTLEDDNTRQHFTRALELIVEPHTTVVQQ
ncbi:MAG: hypothetical protein RL701_2446, partial [Pseudomonadota bacterium]